MASSFRIVGALGVLIVFVTLSAAPVVSQAHTRALADWTLAIYLDSDNNLDTWAQNDLNEMLSVGSTSNVNVIVLWDTATGPAQVYKVLKGELRELKDCKLNGIETNMGDPQTLRDFVSYTLSSFRAERFALLAWDHGDDFRGCMFDDHIPYDGFDLLTHQEVVTALSGFKIDVLIYAACVLSMVEVAYEYYASGLDIDYMVANEGYDPMPGMPYDTILAKVIAQPSMSSLALAKTFVDDYIDYYSVLGERLSMSLDQQYRQVTLSVIQLSKLGDVVSDIKDMASAIIPEMGAYADIVSNARGHGNLPWCENGWERDIDLPTFVKVIHDQSLDAEYTSGIDPAAVASVVSASENAEMSLSDAIVYCRSLWPMEKTGCLGMGVYFPSSRGSFDHCWQIYGDFYSQTLFANEIWLDFLNAYWDV